jgi:hypothetical protein
VGRHAGIIASRGGRRQSGETLSSVIARAKSKPLAKHGGKRKEGQVDNVNLIGGNRTDYLALGLARDAPEILEKRHRRAFPQASAQIKPDGVQRRCLPPVTNLE